MTEYYENYDVDVCLNGVGFCLYDNTILYQEILGCEVSKYIPYDFDYLRDLFYILVERSKLDEHAIYIDGPSSHSNNDMNYCLSGIYHFNRSVMNGPGIEESTCDVLQSCLGYNCFGLVINRLQIISTSFIKMKEDDLKIALQDALEDYKEVNCEVISNKNRLTRKVDFSALEQIEMDWKNDDPKFGNYSLVLHQKGKDFQHIMQCFDELKITTIKDCNLHKINTVVLEKYCISKLGQGPTIIHYYDALTKGYGGLYKYILKEKSQDYSLTEPEKVPLSEEEEDDCIWGIIGWTIAAVEVIPLSMMAYFLLKKAREARPHLP